LGTVDEGCVRMRMDVDEDSIGAHGHRGTRQRGDKILSTRGV
jgi:hypothetical protein